MRSRGDRRYTRPILIPSEGVAPQRFSQVGFESGKDSFSEEWLQRLLFEQPDILPIEQIESAFSEVAPVCRELPTPAGPIDLVLVTETGLPVLVETKLWRNPEARRDAIVQILDYAKEVSGWTAEQFDEAVKRARRDNRTSFDALSDRFDEPDEPTYYDGLARSLSDGRFLLLIVGDGIRDGVENIAHFLQAQVGLRFAFGLVELGVYRVPAVSGALMIQPYVLAKTVEIERAVVRREHTDIEISEPQADSDLRDTSRRIRPQAITEDSFFEALARVDAALPGRLRHFFQACENDLGLKVTVSRASLILHWFDDTFGKVNFGTFFPDGTLRTNYICSSAEDAGDIHIGEEYLETLATLCDGATVRGKSKGKERKPWTWKIVRNGRDPMMAPFLDHADEWLELIETTMSRFRKIAGAG